MLDFQVNSANVSMAGLVLPGFICGMNPHQFHELVETKQIIADNADADAILIEIAEKYEQAYLGKQHLESFESSEIEVIYTTIHNIRVQNQLVAELEMGSNRPEKGNLDKALVLSIANKALQLSQNNCFEYLIDYKSMNKALAYELIVKYYAILKERIADNYKIKGPF